jgi:hypothetical protein
MTEGCTDSSNTDSNDEDCLRMMRRKHNDEGFSEDEDSSDEWNPQTRTFSPARPTSLDLNCDHRFKRTKPVISAHDNWFGVISRGNEKHIYDKFDPSAAVAKHPSSDDDSSDDEKVDESTAQIEPTVQTEPEPAHTEPEPEYSIYQDSWGLDLLPGFTSERATAKPGQAYVDCTAT